VKKQSASISASADKTKESLKRQEAAIIDASVKMKDLNQKIKLTGGSSRLLANNTRAFNTLEKAVGKTAVTSGDLTLRVAKFRSSIATSNRELQLFSKGQQDA